MMHFSYLFILFYIAFSPSSLAIDVLQQGSSLHDGQTLLSSSQIFEFGFFSPKNSYSRYVGIWYHNISSQTVVWVLNRDQPLKPESAILTFQTNGNLVLINPQTQMMYWSTNISSPANTSIQILDMGKLVLQSSNGSMLWDSFDFVVGYDGVVQHEIYDEGKEKWNLILVQPQAGNECDMHAKCGAFGFCRFNGGEAICSCMQGFSSDTSGRCVKKSQLQSELKSTSDGFHEMKIVKVPGTANSGSTAVNEDDCRSECLRNCSCNAYAYVNGNIGCLMWGGDLVYTVHFDNDLSGSTLYIKLAASKLGCKSNTWSKIVIICASAVFLFLLACILLLWKFRFTVVGCFKKEGKPGSTIRSRKLFSLGQTDVSENEEKESDLPWFNLDTMINATSNFILSNKLGEGGFGGVFKGTLPGGIEVAVKKLSLNSSQGHGEFKNEMTLIAKLQHRNLVRLVGCCVHEDEKMLIYEYMPNKSLDSFLFNPAKQHLLDWNRRFSIIEGIARGLVYLHRDSRFRIVHRDLKASNILLDVDMNPKISDFGMARIFGTDQNEQNTHRVVGTFGYMSPEYVMEGFFSFKSDVYSFGILLLELVCGRRNNSFHRMPDTLNIVGYAWKLWDKQRAAEMIDPSILESCSIPQAIRCIQIGLLCVQNRANDRPDMHDVVLMLASAPLFTMEKNPVQTPFFYDMDETCSVNNVTITELLAR